MAENPELLNTRDLSRQLRAAVFRADTEVVSQLVVKVRKGIATFTDYKGRTLMHFAVEAGNMRFIKYLFRGKCPTNKRCNRGNTPFMSLSTLEDSNKHIREIAQFLLKNGANVREKNNNGVDAFSMCFHEHSRLDNRDVAEILCAFKADVNTKDRWGKTPLRKAVIANKSDSVEWLLEFEADCKVRDENNASLLHEAVRVAAAIFRNHRIITKESRFIWKCLLGAGVSVNAEDNHGRTPFHLLLEFGDMEAVLLFFKYIPNLSIKDNDGKSAIHFASINGDSKILELLIENGCDSMALTNNLRVPLHSAVEFGRIDNVKILCYHGTDIDSPDADGNSPLLTLAKNFALADLIKFRLFDRFKMCDLLSDYGANINARNNLDESIMDVVGQNVISRDFFIKFFAKLQVLGIQNIDDHQMNVIYRDPELKALYTKTYNELKRIKNYRRNFPIIQLLTSEMNVLRNPSHVSALLRMDLVKLFPILGLLMQTKLNEVVAK